MGDTPNAQGDRQDPVTLKGNSLSRPPVLRGDKRPTLRRGQHPEGSFPEKKDEGDLPLKTLFRVCLPGHANPLGRMIIVARMIEREGRE